MGAQDMCSTVRTRYRPGAVSEPRAGALLGGLSALGCTSQCEGQTGMAGPGEGAIVSSLGPVLPRMWVWWLSLGSSQLYATAQWSQLWASRL